MEYQPFHFGSQMDTLRAMSLFVKAVELGSLTAAARDAGLGQPAVSKVITSLENELQVRLLERSASTLRLTDEGRRFYDHSKRLLEDYADAVEDVRGQMLEASGLLRVTAPESFGGFCLNKLIIEFQANFPDIAVELDLTDRLVDVVDEDFDVAMRFGNTAPENVVARVAASVRRSIVASHKYLEGAARITTPNDLGQHNYIGYPRAISDTSIALSREGKTDTVKTQSRYKVNSAVALRDCLLQDIGYARVPDWLVQDLLENHRLVRLLPEWTISPHRLTILVPPRRIQPMRVRAFTAFMLERIPALPGLSAPG